MKVNLRVMFLFVVILLAAACSPTGSAQPGPVPGLTDVRMILPYRPDVQFVPFYVGLENGIFEKHGINLKIEHTQESDAVILVGAGEVPFAVVSGEQVLLARAQELPVVYVTAWYQDYPVGIAAPVESGIMDPQDLVGKKVGIPVLSGASYIGYRALLSAAGVSDESIQLDAVGYSQVELLLQGIEDAAVIYAANEPFQLEAQGMPVHVILVSDYVELASNGLITSEALIADQPELVQSMVSALLESMEAAMADPEAAFEHSMNYVDGLDDSNRAVQQAILNESISFWTSERIGFSDPQAWQNMQDVLLEMGLLAAPLALDQAFTNAFIP